MAWCGLNGTPCIVAWVLVSPTVAAVHPRLTCAAGCGVFAARRKCSRHRQRRCACPDAQGRGPAQHARGNGCSGPWNRPHVPRRLLRHSRGPAGCVGARHQGRLPAAGVPAPPRPEPGPGSGRRHEARQRGLRRALQPRKAARVRRPAPAVRLGRARPLPHRSRPRRTSSAARTSMRCSRRWPGRSGSAGSRTSSATSTAQEYRRFEFKRPGMVDPDGRVRPHGRPDGRGAGRPGPAGPSASLRRVVRLRAARGRRPHPGPHRGGPGLGRRRRAVRLLPERAIQETGGQDPGRGAGWSADPAGRHGPPGPGGRAGPATSSCRCACGRSCARRSCKPCLGG